MKRISREYLLQSMKSRLSSETDDPVDFLDAFIAEREGNNFIGGSWYFYRLKPNMSRKKVKSFLIQRKFTLRKELKRLNDYSLWLDKIE